MNDHKLLQELNLTMWQPCKAPITSYVDSVGDQAILFVSDYMLAINLALFMLH